MRMSEIRRLAVLTCASGFLVTHPVQAGDALMEARQDFSTDPRWDGLNKRTDKTPRPTKWQDFDYSPGTAHAGGRPGEVGGAIQVAADPADYAQRLPKPMTFKDRLSASGWVAFPDRRSRGALYDGFLR